VKFRSHTLDNGLEIIAEVNPNAFSLAIGYFVKTGARDEVPSRAGVSHFLEHMLFKGTNRRSAEQVNRELDELGSQSNAYTSEEQTVYYMTVLPENQTRTIDLLTDLMRPALRVEDFETERKVILEEIAMYDDQPPYGAIERAMEEFFGGHPLGIRVLGTAQTVSQLDAEYMRQYHAERYAPDNLCLVAAGAVDFDALVQQAEQLTRSWAPAGHARKLAMPTITPHFVHIQHPPAVQQYLVEIGLGPSRRDEKRFASRVLTSVLGDESGSRIFWELVDNGLADTASLFTQEFQECGLIGAFIVCTPEDLDENWQRFREIVVQCEREPITDKELIQAKNKICSGIVLGAERPSNRLFTVGNAWTLRNTYETVEEVLQNYNRVTVDDVNSALDSWIKQPRVLVTAGPTATCPLKS
jgi:predicted Zn-dependent peptidase